MPPPSVFLAPPSLSSLYAHPARCPCRLRRSSWLLPSCHQQTASPSELASLPVSSSRPPPASSSSPPPPSPSSQPPPSLTAPPPLSSVGRASSSAPRGSP